MGGISVEYPTIESGILFSRGYSYQMSGNLTWDDVNNRLGIGTSSPAGTIDITNSGRLYFGSDTFLETVSPSYAGRSMVRLTTSGTNRGAFLLPFDDSVFGENLATPTRVVQLIGFGPGGTIFIGDTINDVLRVLIGDATGAVDIPLELARGDLVVQNGVMRFQADTQWSRGAANRMDLGSGDALVILGGAGDFAAPVNGMLWYNTTTGKLRVYESGAWQNVV